MIDSVIKLIASIFIFAFVLFLTYFTTRFIAKIQKKSMVNGNIVVIEAQKLSATKDLYIVRIGQEYYALATGKDTVNVIGKLDSSGLVLPEDSPTDDTNGQGGVTESFEKLFEKFKIKKQDKE